MPTASSETATDQELRAAYRTLGVDDRASALAIRHRYRELAQIHHPDKWPLGSPDQAAAAERMRDINAAYDLIEGAPLEHASQPEPELELELELRKSRCRTTSRPIARTSRSIGSYTSTLSR